MKTFFSIFFLLVFISVAYSWGFWGHRQINKMAVFILPSGMIGFYKQNIEYLVDHAIDADKRRYVVKEEAPRHFIDLDRYGKFPFKNLPHPWNDAVKKFSQDTLEAHGIVPWHIEKILVALTNAFKEKNKKKILRLSADLGHYIADAHVPLHTTKNYNGQLTNQLGIHGFWESRLPELFGGQYDYFVGKAQYIKNPQAKIWDIIFQSHQEVDSVLKLEKETRKNFPSDQLYAFETKGGQTIKISSEDFSRAYHEKLNGMVERRLRLAVKNIADFWFTAWINAGQPDLNHLSEEELTEEEKNKMAEEEKQFNEGKILGREE